MESFDISSVSLGLSAISSSFAILLLMLHNNLIAIPLLSEFLFDLVAYTFLSIRVSFCISLLFLRQHHSYILFSIFLFVFLGIVYLLHFKEIIQYFFKFIYHL